VSLGRDREDHPRAAEPGVLRFGVPALERHRRVRHPAADPEPDSPGPGEAPSLAPAAPGDPPGADLDVIRSPVDRDGRAPARPGGHPGASPDRAGGVGARDPDPQHRDACDAPRLPALPHPLSLRSVGEAKHRTGLAWSTRGRRPVGDLQRDLRRLHPLALDLQDALRLDRIDHRDPSLALRLGHALRPGSRGQLRAGGPARAPLSGTVLKNSSGGSMKVIPIPTRPVESHWTPPSRAQTTKPRMRKDPAGNFSSSWRIVPGANTRTVRTMT